LELLPKICANEECGRIYEPKVHNSVYCSTECRRVVTNKKVLNKYYEKKDKKNSKRRICKKKDCETILSRYNEEDICEAHQVERLKDRLQSWGWDRQQLDEDYSY